MSLNQYGYFPGCSQGCSQVQVLKFNEKLKLTLKHDMIILHVCNLLIVTRTGPPVRHWLHAAANVTLKPLFF